MVTMSSSASTPGDGNTSGQGGDANKEVGMCCIINSDNSLLPFEII